MSELPKGWCEAPIELIALPVDKIGNHDSADRKIRYIDISSIDNVKNVVAEAKELTLSDAPSRARQIVKAGDVLFATVRPYLRNIAAVPDAYDGEIASTGFSVLRPVEGIHPKYLFHFCTSTAFVNQLSGIQYGVSYPAVKDEQVRAQTIPIPPANEQKRIVAKIEELFSELDSGIESLKTARVQLKVYRQAVLKHAFEGKLTAAWREKNKDKLESAEQLLKRTPANRSKKLNAPTQAELEKFPELPSGWTYTRLGHFIDSIGAGKSFKCDEREPTKNEIGVAKVSAVTWGEYDEHESKTCLDADKINPEYFIKSGDFLFSRANTIELVGACVIAKTVTKRVMLSDKTLRIVFGDIDPFYFLYYLRSQSGRNEIMERSTGNQESMRNIGQDRIRNIIVPVCSPQEATRVAYEIQEKFSIIENLEATIDAELQKSEALRQSILKKAFCGQLVAQNPADEPASILLERIRTVKSAQKPAKASRAGKKKSPARTATVIQFPNAIPSITTTDLHAGIIGMAYEQHEQHRRTNTFGHVKAEKIAHMVEYHLGIPLGRAPVKDAAGPNDYPHLKKVEHRANMANWFSVQQRTGGEGYVFSKKRGFEGLIAKTNQALGEKAAEVEALLRLFLPLDTQQAEIIATLYAAWNNLLIAGSASPSDEEIVTEARENWHESKLNIERDRFFRGLEWLRKKEVIPSGIGAIVTARSGVA